MAKREKLDDKTVAKRNPQTVAKLMDEIHRSVVHGNGKCDC